MRDEEKAVPVVDSARRPVQAIRELATRSLGGHRFVGALRGALALDGYPAIHGCRRALDVEWSGLLKVKQSVEHLLVLLGGDHLVCHRAPGSHEEEQGPLHSADFLD